MASSWHHNHKKCDDVIGKLGPLAEEFHGKKIKPIEGKHEF
jgi:hypothetical protein